MRNKKFLLFGFAIGLAMPVVSAGWAEESEEAREVVVTATKTKKKLSDVPVRTELIRRGDIEKTSALNLADVVEFTPGVRVENNCQNCNFSNIRLLGLEGAYSQVLINGQPMLSSVASVYGVEHIPARMIDRVEIVKGGASALYGPGAVAGVVNVITREPTKSGGEVNATYESIDERDSSSISALADFVSEDGKTRFSVINQIDTRNPYDRNHDGYSEITERDLQMTGLQYRRSFDDNAELKVEYTKINEERRGGDSFSLPVTQANVAEWIETNRDSGNVAWSQGVSREFDYNITGAFAFTDRDTYYGAGQDPNAFGFTENPYYLVDTQFNHHFNEDRTLTWGVQYNRESLKDSQPAYNRRTSETYNSTGFYVQDDWWISDTVELVSGLRLDKHSELNNWAASPRFALLWIAKEDLDVRANFSRGFRAPQVFDEDLHIALAGGEAQVLRNASNLDEEISTGYSLGAEWTPELGNGQVIVEGTLFHTKIKDTFFNDEQDDPGTSETEFYRINRGTSKVSGVELNLGYKRDHHEFLFGWVHQDSKYNRADDDFNSKDFFRTPDDYGIATYTWDDPEIAKVFVGAKYTGRMKVPHYAGYIPADRLETSESFLTWDVSVAKKIDNMTFTLGCKNLTDEYQDDFDKGVDRDVSYIYGPRFPRTVFVSGKLDF